uniref:Poly [ADP-ribose] polymerase n=1 Tax=Panagrolaimus superbus TaxID=310955 RepID=A0A914YQ50_9BILA
MPAKRKPVAKKAVAKKAVSVAATKKSEPIRKSTRKPVQFVPFSGTSSTPKPKQTKSQSKATKKPKIESKLTAKKTTTSKKGLKVVAKGKITKKIAVKKEAKEKKVKTPRIKNDKLQPRPEIEKLEKNPILYGKGKPEDTETLETVIRLVYRWTHQKDVTNLKKLANDWKHFPTNGFELRYSPFDSRTPVFIALQNDDKKLFDAIQAAKKDAEKQKEKRPSFQVHSLLERMTTGQANIHMLGHRTAKIEMTRGGRQGNNALILFDDLTINDMETGKRLIDSGVSFEMLSHADHLLYSKDSNIYRAIRGGHRKLAASMIEAWARYNFNDLHINTLKFDKQPLPKFMPISTTKKALGNKKITPVHTAAINPNVDYLKAILAVEPVFNQPDTDNWYTIHYAAVCEGSGPLKYLIDRGAPLSILNKNKESPLHCAARAGRLENVKVICDALQKEKLPDAVDEDAIIPKKSKQLSHFGNMLNAKTKVNETPLHYAVKYEHLEVVKYLLKQPEIIVDAAMSAGAEKLTPLILAAQKGNLAILRELIDEGHAFMDLGDKLKRTPLIHATIGGHPHIASELLHRGASINAAPDSSGNTAAHYACAYAWGSVLRLLERAEPACLTQINSWHLTPLCVAFVFKNHMDIVAYLLDEDHGDIKISVNDCDNEGNTLLMLVIKHETTVGSDKQLIDKIEYLIENDANVEVKSATGKTAFHYFASKPVVLKATKPAFGSAAAENKKRFSKDEYFKIVDLLTGNKKAEIAGMIDDSGNTVLEEALEQGNILLAEKVFEWTKKEAIERWTKNVETNEIQTNILHLLFDAAKIVFQTSNAFEFNLGFLNLFENIAKEAKTKIIENGKTLLEAFAKQFDKNGRTPLIHILRDIKQFRVPASTSEGAVQRGEIKKFIQQIIELAREYLKIDKELAFIREKPKKKDDSTTQKSTTNYGGFAFGGLASKMKLGSKKNGSKQNSSIAEAYFPSAFELSLRFWLDDFKEEYMLKENKLVHRNPLFKMMAEELKENGLLKKALLEQDERNGFKGYSPLLFCIQNDVTDSTYKTVNKSALLLAVEKRNLLVAKYLAANTDLASKVDETGRNALHYLSTSPENVVEFLEAIISRGAKPTADKFGRYPLHYAIAAIHTTASTDISTDNIEYLLKVNPEAANKFDCCQRLPIFYAFIPISEKEEKHFAFSSITKADPIAVVVVILKLTKDLSSADIHGNTLIHYAAMAGSNICLLTLIDKCKDINFKNKLSNIPLGLAVSNSNESATMTLIQAGGDVRAKVFCLPPEPLKTEIEKWKWFPDRSSEQSQTSHTILSLVVRNGWQGIIYVILDKLNNQQNVLKNLCAAAIEHRQFNLAQTLLKKLKNDNSVKREASILFEKLAEYCNIQEEATTNLMKSLFSAGMLWQEYETANSKAAEIYAEKCDLHGLQLLKTLDQEFNDGQNWLEHLRSHGALQVLKNFFKSWKGSLPKSEALRLLAFISEFSIACGNISTRLFDFNAPAFDGMEHPRHKKPTPNKQHITPLIYSVQVRKYGLAEFLIGTLKVDVNAKDEYGRTALMHAIMSNDEQMIRILARMKHGHGTEIAEASMMEVVEEEEDEDGTASSDDGDTVESYDPANDDVDDDDATDNDNDESETDNSQAPPKKKAMLLSRKAIKVKAPKISKKNNKKDKKIPLSFKNSKINISASDGNGKTALHYLVEPNGYENIQLVKELFKTETGFIHLISKNDDDGESPLSLAAKLHQKDIFNLFQSYIRKGQSNGVTAAAASIQNPSELPKIESLKSSHDFEKVSKEFVDAQAKSQQKIESEEEKEKRLRTPHNLVQNYDISEIVKDDENGSLYKTLMHKTDVAYGFQGFHNYYRIQLVQRKGGANLFVLFTHWGRIGDPTGQCQHTPFSDKDAATKEFKSIFKAKSGNEWGQEFEEKPNKYRLVEVDETKIDLSELKIELKADESIKDPEYQIIKDISDVEWMRRKWKTVCSQAANAIPFGQVKREKVIKAKAILDQLRPMLTKMEATRFDNTKNNPTDALQKIIKTGKLSNEFYMELALGSFAYSALPVIDNIQVLSTYDKLIEQMLEFEIAGKLITAAAGQKEMDSIK